MEDETIVTAPVVEGDEVATEGEEKKEEATEGEVAA